ncbi:M24 family metallopeptidase [Anaeromyxobacter oryzae]|uniref:Peptidase M24 n=1 Tax=Anaeromyxobacter oryzae TaxID=2918170 RepID=A0ABM7X0B0_9BACT|nr:M24 family metallopeptidase [Anaeromyxobacter oryzae]BDG05224.1 peptidase M24 [Anaeromyxobacter oryzae]
MTELARKLDALRRAALRDGVGAVRLRGLDWTSWVGCGGSAAVLLAAETGVADVLVSADGAWVLTDEIERARLQAEELPPGLEMFAARWWDRGAADAFADRIRGAGALASDRPRPGERPLPPEVVALRRSLGPEELERYRALGRDAAAAVSDVLRAARPDWTGFQLAGAAAGALWSRGVAPALVLAGDARRLLLYRHPTPTSDRLGDRAMLVVCARRHGLYANLTRFVYFRDPTAEEARRGADVTRIEAAALDASRPGATLGAVLDALVAAYAAAGYAGEEARHHQGGTCGYLSRDAVAVPGSTVPLEAGGAVAWNPSLPGAKVEDTFVIGADGLENLTVDPRWPVERIAGRARPLPLVR